jgi:hypothetical protein
MKDQLQLLAGGRDRRRTARPPRPTTSEAARAGLAEARAALEAARDRADAHRIARTTEHRLRQAG